MTGTDVAWVVLSIFLLLPSLMTVLRAKYSILVWQVAWYATELGHLFTLPILLIVIWAIVAQAPLMAIGMLVLSFAFLAYPILSAIFWVPQHFAGETLSLRDCFLGIRRCHAKTKTTHVYQSIDGEDHALDLYWPEAPKEIGILMVHGGGWSSGDPMQAWWINHHWAGQGFAVAALDYRLAPAHRYPSPLHDIRSALAFLSRLSKTADLPKRWVLCGRSAGGHLALLTALQDCPDNVSGVIDFYAPTHFNRTCKSYGYSGVIDGRALGEQFFGGAPDEIPNVYNDASPINLVSWHAPPICILHGARDELVPVGQSRVFVHALLGAKGKHRYHELPWATHGFDFFPWGPGTQVALCAVEEFLKDVLNEDRAS